MQANDCLQVSPKAGVRLGGRVLVGLCSAGVAQPVEHLFCKQVVRGSSPLASSGKGGAGFAKSRLPKRIASQGTVSEGCPSGQREQAVNLPAHAYVGSNPTPSTSTATPSGVLAAKRLADPPRRRRSNTVTSNAGPVRFCEAGASPRLGFQISAGVAQLVERQRVVCRGAAPPQSSESIGAPPQVFGSQAQKLLNVVGLGFQISAGVAQLVERQPSKLNVVGSSPISRSVFSGRGLAADSVLRRTGLPGGVGAGSAGIAIFRARGGLPERAFSPVRRVSLISRRARACLLPEACQARPPYRFPLPT